VDLRVRAVEESWNQLHRTDFTEPTSALVWFTGVRATRLVGGEVRAVIFGKGAGDCR
jgi:hypothetical protein